MLFTRQMISLLASNKVLSSKGYFIKSDDVKPGDHIVCGDGHARPISIIRRKECSSQEAFAFSARSWHTNNYLPSERYELLCDGGFNKLTHLEGVRDVLLPRHLEWNSTNNIRQLQPIVKREWDKTVELYIGYLVGSFFACGYKCTEKGFPRLVFRSGVPSHASRLLRILNWLMHSKNDRIDRIKVFSTTVTIPNELHSLFTEFSANTTNHIAIPKSLLNDSTDYNNGVYQGVIDHYPSHINANTKDVFEQALVAFLKANCYDQTFHDFPLNDYCTNDPHLVDVNFNYIVQLCTNSPMGIVVDGIVLRQPT